MGRKDSQSDQLFTELAECPSQDRPVCFFNSIRKTENVLNYGGVLAEDMLTGHPVWEMPSHAY